MKSLEIRCCCNPGKLLGTVHGMPDTVGNGDLYTFALRDGGKLTLPVAEWCSMSIVEFLFGDDGETEVLREREAKLAIKSMDTPTETLCKIVGFEPANKGD